MYTKDIALLSPQREETKRSNPPEVFIDIEELLRPRQERMAEFLRYVESLKSSTW